MSGNPKVSVVIPVYNTAPYLRQCLDSVVGQTLRDIEIICVDDGSTDDSLSILREYERRDGRVTVLTQKNQYAGVARNNGKAIARGEYLVFWDSDDYFDPRFLEKMYGQIEKDEADIAVCGGKRFYQDAGVEVPAVDYLDPARIPLKVPFNRETNPDYILNFTCEAPWNKMYRKSFIDGLGLDFQPKKNGNDVYFVAVALCLADRITVVREPLVVYRKERSDSLVGTLSTRPFDPLLSWVDVRDELMRRHAYPDKCFQNKVLGIVVYCLNNVSTWKAYREWRDYLLGGGLEALGIDLNPREFYQVPWRYDFLKSLLEMSEGDFLAFWNHWNYSDACAQKARGDEFRNELRCAQREASVSRILIERLRHAIAQTPWIYKAARKTRDLSRKIVNHN